MKILILYGTLTFNTETIAEHMHKVLVDSGKKNVDILNLSEVEDLEIFRNYDFIIFGTSTWSDGEDNPDTEEFYERMNSKLNHGSKDVFANKKFAYFGLGERHYEHFCKSAYDAKKYFEKLGAETVGAVLEIDGYPEEPQLKQAEDWVLSFPLLEERAG